MRLRFWDVLRFPNFARYVSVSMPTVAEVDTIVNAIQRLSSQSALSPILAPFQRARIRNALQWGQGPLIKIVSNLGGATPANGEFTPGIGSNEIRLNLETRVRPFENGSPSARGRTSTGRVVYRVGVTLLHELTHWADDQDGIDYTGTLGAGEEGDAYAITVYGRSRP